MNEPCFKPSISEENGLKHIQHTDLNILSIGVSTCGSAEFRMLENNPRCYVTATSIDKKGIPQTWRLMEKHDLIERMVLKFEDLRNPMPYPDNHFDFIWARLVLHYLNDAEMTFALSEISRVLKPSGRIFIVVKSEKDYTVSNQGSEFVPETGMTKTPATNTIGTPNVKFRERRLYSPELLRKVLSNAGFNAEYIKEYDEHLYRDYMRTELSAKAATVLETLATK